MDAITLDILIDPNGEARRVLEELKADFLLAGNSAEDAAKKVEKFEQGIKEQSAKRQATERLKELGQAHGDAGKAAQTHAEINSRLAQSVLQYAAPAVIVSATKKTLEYADSLVELSQKTGFSIEGLQRIGQVAKMSGSSFEQVAGAMNQLQNRLESGNKKAEAALRALGIAHDDYMRRSPDEQFREVAEAIAGIEDPAKRTEAAMALLGRSGAELIPTFLAIKDGGLEAASVLSTDFVQAAADANDELDKLMTKGQQMMQVFLAWPLLWVKTLQDWRAALVDFGRGMPSNLPAVGSPTNPFIPKTAVPADPFAPGAFGGNSLSFVEKELTDAVKDNIRARKKNTQAADELALAEFEASALNQRLRANEWASTARGGMFGPGWGQNIPGVGPGQFPGWALPFDPLQNRMNLDFSGANVNGSGAWMLRQPVESALGGATSGGGNWLSRMFSGRAGQVAGGVLGMLPGLIPGLSGRGASVGGSAGSLIGSLVGGPLAPILGPIGGFLGGAIGKLFGKREGARVNDQRDEFVAQFGDIHALNALLHEAGGNVDRLLAAKTENGLKKAIEEINQLLGDQAEDQQRLRAAMEKYGLSIADMGQKFKQTEITKGFKELGDDFRVLVGAGADFNKVAEKMAPEFGALIHTAIETGTTVPRELEPILAKMIEMGMLTDKNGDKFTELGQIPFAESMTEGFNKIVDAIKELTAVLSGELPAAARRGVDGANAAFRDLQPPDLNFGGPGGRPEVPDTGEPVYVSQGGIIHGKGRVLYFDKGGFVPRGSDTIPAMLTPGEMVISRDMVRDLAKLGEGDARLPFMRGGEVGPELPAPPVSRTQPVPPPQNTILPIFIEAGGREPEDVKREVMNSLPREIFSNAGQTRAALSKLIDERLAVALRRRRVA
jgi:hypothetical protein